MCGENEGWGYILNKSLCWLINSFERKILNVISKKMFYVMYNEELM